MKKKPRTARPRAAARARTRSEQKLVELRSKLALLEEGGGEERPVVVGSASVVEVRAEGFSCLRCEGALRTTTHESLFRAGRSLRKVELVCRACGAPRTLFFRVETAQSH